MNLFLKTDYIWYSKNLSVTNKIFCGLFTLLYAGTGMELALLFI